jgi:hypothetical protein
MRPYFLAAMCLLAAPVAAQPIIVPLTPQKQTQPPPPPAPSPVPVAPPQAGGEAEAGRPATGDKATRPPPSEDMTSQPDREQPQ